MENLLKNMLNNKIFRKEKCVMKKKMEEPRLELVVFETEDILTTSGDPAETEDDVL